MAEAVTVAAGAIVDRQAPLHHFLDEPEQFRVKLQTYSRVPPEVTVRKADFTSDEHRYFNAYRRGQSSAFPRRARPDPEAPRDPESVERAQRRAKSQLRRLVMELAPTDFVTFTTRAVLSRDDLLSVWQSFGRLCDRAGVRFEYVAVPEPHPTNRAHLHIHAAVRGESRVSFKLWRRLWHIALEAHFGRRVTRTLRGSDSPGNIDVQPVKARQVVGKIRKIARYISKYITKDLISEFNRKRYWPSKGIDLAAARVFWLSATSLADAVREACQLLTIPEPSRMFSPSDSLGFWALDPDSVADPPGA